jgi:hypothetical protein
MIVSGTALTGVADIKVVPEVEKISQYTIKLT